MPTRRSPANPRLGRPSKLTPEAQEIICDHIRAGSYLNVAAQTIGVAPETISEWKLWGREDIQNGVEDSIYARFWEAVARAEAQAEFAGVLRIRSAGIADWKAEAWFLERRFPERWSPKQTFAVESATVEGPINADFIVSGRAAEVVDAVFDAYEAQNTLHLNGHGPE